MQPELVSSQKNDEWIPQFIQDSLTTNLARYSKMTIIDRTNEARVLAEQKLSTGAQYDENTAIEIGKIIFAKYLLEGSVQMLSKNYSLTFKVKNIETNEIKAAFQKYYTREQIENGEAAQEISKEIMLGLGIELDSKALADLSKTNDKAIAVNKNLAKGAAAEKNEEFVTALQYFAQVQEADPTKTEAEKSIQNIFGGNISTQGVKAQIEYGQNMIKRWNKIFLDLINYMASDDMPIIVYDFSNLNNNINYNSGKGSVSFEISPGIKVFPNRSALLVFKTICDTWEKLAADSRNEWCKEVKTFLYWKGNKQFENHVNLTVTIVSKLYDSYGDALTKKENTWTINLNRSDIVAQHKYYNNGKLYPCKFDYITTDNITDTVTPKITNVNILFTSSSFNSPKISKEIHPRIFTVQEYNDWLAAGCP